MANMKIHREHVMRHQDNLMSHHNLVDENEKYEHMKITMW